MNATRNAAETELIVSDPVRARHLQHIQEYDKTGIGSGGSKWPDSFR